MTNQVSNPITPLVSENPVSQASKPRWQEILDQIKPIVLTLFNKFYTNKKVFWPVTIAFGFIFFVIFIGLVFGKRNTNTVGPVSPTRTPFILRSQSTIQNSEVLTKSESDLNSLKKQIEALDVKQVRLKPPILNFDIKF